MKQSPRLSLRAVPQITKRLVRRGIKSLGYDIVPSPDSLPPDFDAEIRSIVSTVEPFTLTSPERIHALCQAIDYITRAGIPGTIVECGVWRGGSMMAACLRLRSLGVVDRELVLFDTFEGMTAPDDAHDVAIDGTTGSAFLAAGDASLHPIWEDERGCAYASEAEVRANLRSTGYPESRLTFVPGKVEDTLPGRAPEQIALLRLDTDWYESTRHELTHLFPRLVPGAVLIIDDYGHWIGAKKAVDEYLEANNVPLLLNRIDYSGRIGVVPGSSG